MIEHHHRVRVLASLFTLFFGARVCSVAIFKGPDRRDVNVAWEFHQIGRDLNKRQVYSRPLLKVRRNY